MCLAKERNTIREKMQKALFKVMKEDREYRRSDLKKLFEKNKTLKYLNGEYAEYTNCYYSIYSYSDRFGNFLKSMERKGLISIDKSNVKIFKYSKIV